MDRIKRLAEILVDHSIGVKKGEVIKLNFGYEASDLAHECYKLIIQRGATARTNVMVPGFAYTFYKHATDEQLERIPKIGMYEAKNVDAVISIGTEYNTREFTNIDPKKVAKRSKAAKKVSDVYINRDRWVFCEFPTHSLAQDAEMSLEEFEDLFYKASIRDWKKERQKQEKIRKFLDKGKQVRLVAADTDISFSIEGRTSVVSYGLHNLPDGEVYIAPVEDTVEGFIKYTYPAIRSGREVDGVYLEFEKGKVVTARAKKNEAFLKEMIKIDKGASYLGEFGIGTNYNIKDFVKQIIFDEKMGGTIHLALGMAYKKGGGKNESALHWDMIKDLRKGGEIQVDGKVIQRNGKLLI